MTTDCPFCTPVAERIVEVTGLILVLRDGYPVSPGHTLVVPRRHVGSFFDATAEEQAEVLAAVVRTKRGLDQRCAPVGYNLGLNDGPAAGQTVGHCQSISSLNGGCAMRSVLRSSASFTVSRDPEIYLQDMRTARARIAAIHDVLAHGYFGLDDDILWDVITNKVPQVESALESILGGHS